MEFFNLVGYIITGEIVWDTVVLSTDTSIRQEAKKQFAERVSLYRLDVFDSSDNLVIQFMR